MFNSPPAAAGGALPDGGGILARTGALRGVGVAPSLRVSKFHGKVGVARNSHRCKGSFTLTEAEQTFNERNLNAMLEV